MIRRTQRPPAQRGAGRVSRPWPVLLAARLFARGGRMEIPIVVVVLLIALLVMLAIATRRR
jgi:hypothetical protein